MTGAAAVFEAVEAGDRQRLCELLAAAPNLACARDAEGCTPLQRATLRCDRYAARILADHGAPVDLFVACGFGWADHVAALLGHDTALVNAELDGIPLLERVCEHGRVEIGRLLVDAGADCDLFSACALGLDDLVHYWLECQPELLRARRRLHEYEPLHCAAECGHPAVARLLLLRGASVTAREADGCTPLHLAVYGPRRAPVNEGHRDVCRILLDHGADPHATDRLGRTVVQNAERSARLHREHGVDDTLALELLDLVRGHAERV